MDENDWKNVQRKIGARLTRARELAGYGTAAAFQDKLDISPATYLQHEAGDRGFDYETARGHAEKLGNVSPAWLLYGEGDPPRDLRPAPRAEPVPPPRLPPATSRSAEPAPVAHAVERVTATPRVAPPQAAAPVARRTRDLPVYNVGDVRTTQLDHAPVVDRIHTPPGLHDIEGAFAVYADSDSMEPRYFAGDLLYLHPRRAPAPGDWVLAIPHGVVHPALDRGAIKRLVRRGGGTLTLEQYSPPAMVEIDATSLTLYRIMSQAELWGV